MGKCLQGGVRTKKKEVIRKCVCQTYIFVKHGILNVVYNNMNKDMNARDFILDTSCCET